MRHVRLAAAILAAVAIVLQPAAAHAAPPPAAPAPYYLAVGDSLSFGFQQAKFLSEVSTGSYSPASFNTGFVDDFAARLATQRPALQTVNYSCPGETSASFISGGCQFHALFALHDNYPASQSQLDAAVAFLRAHPRQVSPITVNLGANDLNALFGACANDQTCVQNGLPAALAQFGANLDTILTALHQAAPGARILVVDTPDAYEYAQPSTVPIFGALDVTTGAVAAMDHATLVDTFLPALSYTQAQWCTLSYVCTPPLFDVHPTDAGYTVIADLVWNAWSGRTG